MKKAFTLAEVLITLAVIGIVAAITIPVIIANYQERSIKAAVKKNYSVIKQALDRYQFEHGERLLPEDIERLTLKSKIIKYFNVAKACDGTAACINHSVYKNKTGTSAVAATGQSYLDDGQFVLNDGSIIFIENASSGYLFISVDVNGNRGPNRLGKDLFMFEISKNGELIPMGSTETQLPANVYCSDTSKDPLNGGGCTVNMLM